MYCANKISRRECMDKRRNCKKGNGERLLSFVSGFTSVAKQIRVRSALTLCKVGSGSVPVENNFGAQHLVAVSLCTGYSKCATTFEVKIDISVAESWEQSKCKLDPRKINLLKGLRDKLVRMYKSSASICNKLNVLYRTVAFQYSTCMYGTFSATRDWQLVAVSKFHQAVHSNKAKYQYTCRRSTK